MSGKLAVLIGLLEHMKTFRRPDRFVIVSNYTQTLDLLARVMEQKRWGYFQLDGSTNVVKRQEYVDRFNAGENYVFLLSSKAGGTGINLIGANRLVLFDPDWNPANDHQAMCRCWREGQDKPCFIYRLLGTGTIDEKIYQRGVSKDGLSKSLVDGDGGDMAGEFSANDLKQLFTLQTDTISNTHDLLGCRCSKVTKKVFGFERKNIKIDELSKWTHHSEPESWCKADDALGSAPPGAVTMAFTLYKDTSKLQDLGENELENEFEGGDGDEDGEKEEEFADDCP
eukprot:TRINITY_DN2354_c0_g2_i1.p1 TRINITY_DN2354_c0_g2~~TRINITY_DN2354_c0_g2_i1.p1  ORF type:complete len:283 (+),score=91.99 TRINITY_DN2354_c0_g2_i1:129-977(+)